MTTIDLQSSDQWELLVSVYRNILEYYQVQENLNDALAGDEPRKVGRKRKKVEDGDEEIGIKSKKQALPVQNSIGLEIEKYLKIDEFGPSPMIVELDHSPLRPTLPGFNMSFEPDKIDLVKEYLYIDQVVTDVHVLAISPTDGKSILTTATLKDFIKKLYTECTARTELIRLSNQLDPQLKEALFSDREDFYMHFCREGMSFNKPYLTKSMREKFETIKDQYHKDLLDGDILHVPFSECEKRTLSRFPDPRTCVDEICCFLPGRSGIDIIRYLEENGVPSALNYEQLLEQDKIRLSLHDESMNNNKENKNEVLFMPENVISYSTTPKRNQQNTLSAMKTRESGSFGTSCGMEKQASKTLLSSLRYLGKSSSPTDAIVDCKFDPTGRTSKVIIGTAKNERSVSAVNVSVLYDLQKGTIHSFNEHADTVSASDFTIDGEHIITASYDLNIIVRESSTGKVVRYLGKTDDEHIQHEDKILNMVLHKSKREFISTFSSRQIMVWNVNTGKMACELTREAPVTGDVIDMCFAEGRYGDVLVVGCEALNNKGELRLWDTTTSALLKSIYEPRGTISSICTNSSSSILSATKSVLRLFDFRSPDETVCLYKTGQNDVNIVSYSPCERFIQSSATDNRCIIFDVRVPSRPLHTLCHMAPLTHDISGQVGINSATWTRDGHFLMTGGEDGFVRLWDVMAGDPLVNSLESNSPICACDISQYYDLVIAGDEASTVKVWSLSGSQYKINDEDLVHINNSDRYLSDNIAGNDLFQIIDDIQLSDLREGVLVNNVLNQEMQMDNVIPRANIPFIDLIPYSEPFFSSASEEYDSDDM